MCLLKTSRDWLTVLVWVVMDSDLHKMYYLLYDYGFDNIVVVVVVAAVAAAAGEPIDDDCVADGLFAAVAIGNDVAAMAFVAGNIVAVGDVVVVAQ